MTDKDKSEFANAMGSFCLACSVEVNKEILKIYFLALQDIDIADFKVAIQRLILTWDSPGKLPTPAMFIAAINGIIEQQAEKAIAIALDNCSVYDSVKFVDDALMVAIERVFGTWQLFCNNAYSMPEKEWVWRKKDLVSNYVEAVQFARKPKRQYFAGLFETANVDFPTRIPKNIKLIDKNGKKDYIERKLIADSGYSLKQLQAGIAENLNEMENSNG